LFFIRSQFLKKNALDSLIRLRIQKPLCLQGFRVIFAIPAARAYNFFYIPDHFLLDLPIRPYI